MRFIFPHQFMRVVADCGLMLSAALMVQMAAAEPGAAGQLAFDVTNVQQVIRLGAENSTASHVIRLEGAVWWASPAQGRLVLADESGAAELQMDLAGQPVETGQRVRVEGNGTISREGAGFRLGARGTIVDNDGVHDMAEKSGAVYLKAGRQPIQVDWFNGVEKFGLEVEYKGPDLPRQKIPDAVLFRLQPE